MLSSSQHGSLAYSDFGIDPQTKESNKDHLSNCFGCSSRSPQNPGTAGSLRALLTRRNRVKLCRVQGAVKKVPESLGGLIGLYRVVTGHI